MPAVADRTGVHAPESSNVERIVARRAEASRMVMDQAGRGKSLWVRFRKTNGAWREMVCRVLDVNDHGNLVVLETTRDARGRFKAQQIRSIRPDSISRLHLRGRRVRV